MKRPRTYRDFVLVMAMTQSNLMHSSHGGHRTPQNPFTDWGWVGPGGELRRGFRRLADAKKDVESVHGKVDWRPDLRGRQWLGEYGPHYTADEWLRRSSGTEAACDTPGSTK